VLKKEGVTMSVSEAQKKANRQWDKENMITLGCKVKREQAEKFKKYAADNGKTANALLKDFVLEKISENEGE
jgi:hypothetical protein